MGDGWWDDRRGNEADFQACVRIQWFSQQLTLSAEGRYLSKWRGKTPLSAPESARFIRGPDDDVRVPNWNWWNSAVNRGAARETRMATVTVATR